VFGEEPITGIFTRTDEAKGEINQALNKIGINPDIAKGISLALAPLFVAGMTSLDLTPVGGEKKAAEKIALSKNVDEIVDIIRPLFKGKVDEELRIIAEPLTEINKAEEVKKYLQTQGDDFIKGLVKDFEDTKLIQGKKSLPEEKQGVSTVDALFGKKAVVEPPMALGEAPVSKVNLDKFIEAEKGMAKTKEVVPMVNNTKMSPKNFKTAEDYVKAQTNAYHGTNKDFEVFSKDFIGENQPTDFGQGLSFAKDRQSAVGYAKEAGGNKVMDVKLDIKNPAKNKDLLDPEIQSAIDDEMGFKDVGDVLKEKGFDGIEFTRADGSIEYTVFDTNQIKTKSQLISEWNKANEEIKIFGVRPEVKVKTPSQKRLESSVYKRLKEDLPEEIKASAQYNKLNLKKDAEKAVRLIEEDKNKALRIGLGYEDAPKGQTSTAVNIALSEKARRDGNHALQGRLIKTRSLEQTKRGQEIVAEKGSIVNNSADRYIKELISAKLDKLGNKYLDKFNVRRQLGKKTAKTSAVDKIAREVKKIEKTFKEIDISEAQKLIDGLACDY